MCDLAVIYCSVLSCSRSTSVWATVKSQQKVALLGVIAVGSAEAWTEDCGFAKDVDEMVPSDPS